MKIEDPDNIRAMIMSFCRRVVPDCDEIVCNLQSIHPEWSDRDLAANLMEFGRGQISKIDEPTETDMQFIVNYVGSLSFDGGGTDFFLAYAGGCIMGLVQAGQLARSEFIQALGYSREYAREQME